MRMRRWWFVVTLVFYAFNATVFDAAADELPLFYKGIRPLGMGGAFTAVADDENAMFYNPAGLNSIEGFGRAAILNPYAEAGKNTWTFYKDVKDVADAKTTAEQTALASALLDKWLGEHFHFRTGLFPNVTFHNFGVGVLGQATFDGVVHNPLGINTLKLRGGYDIALLVSGAYGFEGALGRLRVGITGKAINRRLLDQTYTTADLVAQNGIDLHRDLAKGNGAGADAGAIYTLPVFLRPSLGVAVQNIGDIRLGDAGRLQQQLNLGLAVRPPVGLGKLLVAADVVDVTRQLGTDTDIAKRLNAGVEYRFPVIFAVRAGLHQGYPSYGATANFWIVRLDYAYYIEEVGAYAGQLPNRRNMVQMTIGF